MAQAILPVARSPLDHVQRQVSLTAQATALLSYLLVKAALASRMASEPLEALATPLVAHPLVAHLLPQEVKQHLEAAAIHHKHLSACLLALALPQAVLEPALAAHLCSVVHSKAAKALALLQVLSQHHKALGLLAAHHHKALAHLGILNRQHKALVLLASLHPLVELLSKQHQALVLLATLQPPLHLQTPQHLLSQVPLPA